MSTNRFNASIFPSKLSKTKTKYLNSNGETMGSDPWKMPDICYVQYREYIAIHDFTFFSILISLSIRWQEQEFLTTT